MKLFLHVSRHSGDTILLRPLIAQVVKQFSSDNVCVECLPKDAYLLRDLGVSIVYSDVIDYNSSRPTRNSLLRGNLFFNLLLTDTPFWDDIRSMGHTYQLLVHVFNRQMIRYRRPEHCLPIPDTHPTIDFDITASSKIEVKPNGWLIENGPCRSGQSSNALNNDLVGKLSSDFPSLTFYCSARPNCADNVVDVSMLNLVELSKLSDSLSGLITKASGVNAATYTEANRNKPRLFFDVQRNYPSMVRGFWDGKAVFVDSYDDLKSYLSRSYVT